MVGVDSGTALSSSTALNPAMAMQANAMMAGSGGVANMVPVNVMGVPMMMVNNMMPMMPNMLMPNVMPMANMSLMANMMNQQVQAHAHAHAHAQANAEHSLIKSEPVPEGSEPATSPAHDKAEEVRAMDSALTLSQMQTIAATSASTSALLSPATTGASTVPLMSSAPAPGLPFLVGATMLSQPPSGMFPSMSMMGSTPNAGTPPPTFATQSAQ